MRSPKGGGTSAGPTAPSSISAAGCRAIRSHRAPPPGAPCRPPTRRKAGCTTCEAAPGAMRACRQSGFTLVALLIAVAIMGAGFAALGELASHAAQREREKQLLFI